MVKVLSETTEFPLQKMGEMAGICWNSPTDDVEKNINRAKDCIQSGHGRVLEFVDIELCLEGYSARCIREYYTHIGGSPTRLQESTRYVNCEDFAFYIPSTVKSEVALIEYKHCMNNIAVSYANLLELGVSREDAANVLPLGMATKIVDKRNLRNLINLMNQRLCSRAYSEIRVLANEIKGELSKISPEWAWICEVLFVPKCEASGFCTEKQSCGRKPRKIVRG